MKKITLALYDAINPKAPIDKVILDLPQGRKISEVAKTWMRDAYEGQPFIEEVVHDDGRKTRFCFTTTSDFFLAWNIKPKN